MAASTILVARQGKIDPATGLAPITIHVFARIAVGKGWGWKHKGSVRARSGLAGRQNFRTWPQQRAGIYEPCPEGHYKLGCHDAAGKWVPAGIDWKGKPNDYNSLHPVINSPVWIATDCKDLQGRYRAIGLHLDAGTPGTAGCLGLLLPELKKLINLLNGYGAPTDLYCDWGKGYVKDKLPAGLVFP